MSSAPVPAQLRDVSFGLRQVREELASQLRGKDEVIELSLAAFLAGGHLLLEGPPGTGKTSLAKAMARAFGGVFRRIQMTSDLLPSDVVGILRLKPGQQEFEFRRGPIFANFLLADELNRTSPKTQSALLEAMAEGTVTVDGTSHRLPDPFFVIATQNPLEFHGVYPLAESQLDRFMLQLTLGSPQRDAELGIYQASLSQRPEPAGAAKEGGPEAPHAHALELRAHAQRTHIEASVLEYIANLVRATRDLPDVAYGVSVRGGLQFIAAVRALAFVRGRDYATPADVSDLAVPVLAHRLCFEGGDPELARKEAAVRSLLGQVPAPK